MASDIRVARLGVLGAVAILLFGLLGTRLWFLQTVEADRLQEDLQVERTKTVPLIPERGRIFDADGRILADNERMLTVAVDWAAMRDDQDRRELFRRLSGWIDVPVREMEQRFRADVYSPFLPMPVKEDIESEEIAVGLRERSEDFPGVYIVEDWKRTYPYAPLAAHVLGYMGRLDPDNLDAYVDDGYQRNEIVGKAGVELSMEKVLHGQWGEVVYEVNAAGQVLREISRKPAVNGEDIQLSVDLDVQQYAESVLKTQLDRTRNFEYENWAPNPVVEDPNTGQPHRIDVNQGERVPFKAPAGSVVVMNQENGQVAAMASYPTFDNRWFNAGVSGDRFEELFPSEESYLSDTCDEQCARIEAGDNSTLSNRAIQGQYNLGSTFKTFSAYAALASGILGVNDHYVDDGVYEMETIDAAARAEGVRYQFRNATCPGGQPCTYGPVNAYWALAVSSDTFFYNIGEKAYLHEGNIFEDHVSKFGFGADTGIDLPYEWDGRIPTNEAKKELNDAGVLADGEVDSLTPGDFLQTAIGQGLMAATPIQLATGYAAVGNGGDVLVPHVVRAIFEPGVPDGQPGYADLSRGRVVRNYLEPDVSKQVEFLPEHRDAIVGGLRQNITGPGIAGRSTTAEELFKDGLYPADAIQIAGKTGTAQGFRSYPWNDSSAFAAFSLDPERPYTVVSYLEKAGYGSRGAAPVVKCMYLALSGKIPTQQVTLSDPLDPDSAEVAEPADPVGTECMRATNFYPEGNVNVAVRPTD